MKANKGIVAIVLVVSAYSVLARQAVPVLDVNDVGSATDHSRQPSSIVATLSRVERKLDARNRAQVNMQRQLDQLQTEVDSLRGVTELHSHKLSQVLERQRELYQELDRRVSEALKPANRAPLAIANTGSNIVPALNYSSDLTENEAYDRAVNLVLKDKRYDDAIPAFQEFNNKYPNSSSAANAHYWLGQLLFNKTKLNEAKQEFTIVVEQHVDSGKRQDAMLKLAMVAQKQDKIADAISLYQQVIKEYPDSTSAQLAKPRLESLQP
jgi:tol-pal system protein YbgF